MFGSAISHVGHNCYTLVSSAGIDICLLEKASRYWWNKSEKYTSQYYITYTVLQTSSESKSLQQHIRVHCKAIRARDSGKLRPGSLCFGFCHIITTLKASYLNWIFYLRYERNMSKPLL